MVMGRNEELLKIVEKTQEERRDLSRIATKEIGVPIKIYWSKIHHNFVAKNGKSGRTFYEFLTGRPFSVFELKREWWNGRPGRQKEVFEEGIRQREEIEKKKKLNDRDLHEYAAGEVYDYALSPCPKKNYHIGTKK
jgi:hypothetical protein